MTKCLTWRKREDHFHRSAVHFGLWHKYKPIREIYVEILNRYNIVLNDDTCAENILWWISRHRERSVSTRAQGENVFHRTIVNMLEMSFTLIHQLLPPLTNVSIWSSSKIILITQPCTCFWVWFPWLHTSAQITNIWQDSSFCGNQTSHNTTERSTLLCRKEPRHLGFQSAEYEKLALVLLSPYSHVPPARKGLVIRVAGSYSAATSRQDPQSSRTIKKSPTWSDICLRE